MANSLSVPVIHTHFCVSLDMIPWDCVLYIVHELTGIGIFFVTESLSVPVIPYAHTTKNSVPAKNAM